jgi:hypothetical protein
MRSQRLCGTRPTTVEGVLEAVFALQAQDTRASRLAVRARSDGLSAADVIRACNETRSVVRTWAMRGTLHMVAAEDVGWLVNLLGPGIAAADRRRRLQLGLDDALSERALKAIKAILAASGSLTRAELMERLARKGVKVDPSTNAAAHLCVYAAAHGLICRGPDRPDDEPTYVLLEDWVGKQQALQPEAALAELARRYLKGHAPAAVDDFTAWSGLSLTLARRAFGLIAPTQDEVARSGKARDRGPMCVRLLGAFDAYLLGYRSRAFALDQRFAKRVQAGGGWIHPTVVVDGRVVGTWRPQRSPDSVIVAIHPFTHLDSVVVGSLEKDAADVGRFLGLGSAMKNESPPFRED